MPLSEFYRMAQGDVEGSPEKTTTCSTGFVPDNELVELVWENGQVMLQGQSSRSRKTPKIPTSSNFNFQADRFRDKDIASQSAAKPGKYGVIHSIYSDIATSVPSGETSLSQDDDMVPWFNYHIDDALQQDYCPDFLPELSGVTVNEHPNRNSFASMEKRDRSNQILRDSHNVSVHNNLSLGQGNVSKLPSASSAQLYPWSLPQGQPSAPSGVSSVSDIISTNTNNIHHDASGNLVSAQASVSLFSHSKTQKQDSALPRSNSSLLNFSHFSRPAAMARASIQNASNLTPSSSLGADRMGVNDKAVPATCKNLSESRHLDPNCVIPKEMNFNSRPNLVPANVNLKPSEPKPVEESHPSRPSDNVFREDVRKNDKSPSQDHGGNAAKGVPDNEKPAEHVGASSVCSGNSVERASNDPTLNFKRKSRYTEESEGQSEDVEEESVGVKKAPPARGGSGSKRSRAAEVHNLSERRRRDRINEKMRALQELIPNCNKVDKASMLDEAIEYLKTLQLQVQIMSMGAGLYMPQMMLPTGMQHIHAAHLSHFSPMSVGMGMGFGINMLDMHGGARGCSMMPMPPMQRPHYPSPSIPGSTTFQGMAGATNLQVFGHPSQGIPMSVAGAPLLPMSGRPPLTSGVGMSPLRFGVNLEAPTVAPNLDSKDLTQTTNSQVINSDDAGMSSNQQSNQFQETNEGFDQPALVSDKGPDGDGNVAVNSTNTNDAKPSTEASCS